MKQFTTWVAVLAVVALAVPAIASDKPEGTCKSQVTAQKSCETKSSCSSKGQLTATKSCETKSSCSSKGQLTATQSCETKSSCSTKGQLTATKSCETKSSCSTKAQLTSKEECASGMCGSAKPGCCASKAQMTSTEKSCSSKAVATAAKSECCASKAQMTSTEKSCSSKAQTTSTEKSCSSKAVVTSHQDSGCMKPCCASKAQMTSTEKSCSSKAQMTSTEKSCSSSKSSCGSMPTLTFKVGDTTTECSKQAATLASKCADSKMVYVVAGKEFTCEQSAWKHLADASERAVANFCAVQGAAKTESQTCPMTGKVYTKKVDGSVYTVAGKSLECSQSAAKLAAAAKGACESVKVTYRAAGKDFCCDKMATDAAGKDGKVTYVVAGKETACSVEARVLTARAKMAAAQKAVADL